MKNTYCVITETANVTPIEDIRLYFHPALKSGLNRCSPGRKIRRLISIMGSINAITGAKNNWIRYITF